MGPTDTRTNRAASRLASAAAMSAENERLKAALGTVTRMRVMTDDVCNRITLAAAIKLARDTLDSDVGDRTEPTTTAAVA